jgi:hypothetical protein
MPETLITYKTDDRQEARVRRIARQHGYSIHKSRRALSLDNFGGYMLIDVNTNAVVAGPRFDLSLDDIEDWL